MTWTPIEDLESLYNTNFDPDNVSVITAKPSLVRGDEGLGDPRGASGLIQFQEAEFIGFTHINSYRRHEEFEIRFNVFYNGNLTVLREIVAELDRIHNNNNVSASRTYLVYYKRFLDKSYKKEGIIPAVVTLVYLDVEVNT